MYLPACHVLSTLPIIVFQMVTFAMKRNIVVIPGWAVKQTLVVISDCCQYARISSKSPIEVENLDDLINGWMPSVHLINGDGARCQYASSLLTTLCSGVEAPRDNTQGARVKGKVVTVQKAALRRGTTQCRQAQIMVEITATNHMALKKNLPLN